MAYGYNPYGGYGVPAQVPMYTQQGAQTTYMAQQMAQPQQTPQMQQPNVTVRMVTSRDEATTAQIPFDSTINIFVNLSAGEIYIKRFNPNTGGALFADYVDAARAQQTMQAAQEPAPEYATVDMVQALENRVSELADAMSAKRKRTVQADE